MSVLHFDMCQKLRKAFADFARDAEQQAERTSKAVREEELRQGWARRHTPMEPPESAA